MSLFKKPKDLDTKQTVKMLVYGQPGAGKSTIALSAPRPVMLDFDGGVNRVAGAFQCDTLQVHNWEEVNLALNEDLSMYDTIIIDTVGKMLDYMSAFIVKNDRKLSGRGGGLSLQGFGVRKQMFIDFVARCSTMGKHLVFVAHEKEEKDGDIRIIRPEIGGSSLSDLMKELDLVAYFEKENGERTIYWESEGRFYTKNSCNLPKKSKIKMLIDKDGNVLQQNDFLIRVFDWYESNIKKQAVLKKKFDDILSQIKNDVNKIVDVETANAIRTKVLSYEIVWDSQLRAKQYLEAKCSSLNLSYNQAEEKYEPAA